MTQHNGIIELHTIENVGANANHMGLLTAQFVHYDDWQQLKVWLPKSGYQKWDYGNYQIVKITTQTIEEQGCVEDKVSGSIQMLFDTLGFSGGNYSLEIEHPKGGKHCLHFQKHTEFVPKKPKTIEPLKSDDSLRKEFW